MSMDRMPFEKVKPFRAMGIPINWDKGTNSLYLNLSGQRVPVAVCNLRKLPAPCRTLIPDNRMALRFPVPVSRISSVCYLFTVEEFADFLHVGNQAYLDERDKVMRHGKRDRALILSQLMKKAPVALLHDRGRWKWVWAVDCQMAPIIGGSI